MDSDLIPLEGNRDLGWRVWNTKAFWRPVARSREYLVSTLTGAIDPDNPRLAELQVGENHQRWSPSVWRYGKGSPIAPAWM